MQLSIQGALCSNSRDLTKLNPDYMEDMHSATCLLCASGGDLRGVVHREGEREHHQHIVQKANSRAQP